MLSIVIPAYNEEESLGECIDEIIDVLKKNNIYKTSEIIVVNDGSKDNTALIAKKKKTILINNPSNMGYGYSLKRGISVAKNEIIAITDADSTYPFKYIIDMLREKEKGYDLVVGARSGKYYRESFNKNLLRKILKIIVEYITGRKVKDVNSGFRLFNKSTIIKYFPKLCNSFSFTTTQTLAYFMNSQTVCYVDIEYNKRKGKSKVRLLKDSLKSIKYILKIGIYYNPLRIFSFFSTLCILLSLVCLCLFLIQNASFLFILGIAGVILASIFLVLGLCLLIFNRFNK